MHIIYNFSYLLNLFAHAHTCLTRVHHNCTFDHVLKESKLISSSQGFFIKRLAILILHLITVSMAVYQRPNIKFSLVRGIKEGTGDITTEDVSRC